VKEKLNMRHKIHLILQNNNLSEEEKLTYICEMIQEERKDRSYYVTARENPMLVALNIWDDHLRTPLMVAAIEGYVSIVKYLLAQKETLIYFCDARNNNILHLILFKYMKTLEESNCKKLREITKILLYSEADRRLDPDYYDRDSDSDMPFLEMKQYNIGTGFANVLKNIKSKMMPELGNIIKEVETKLSGLKDLKEKVAAKLKIPLPRYKLIPNESSIFQSVQSFFASSTSSIGKDNKSKSNSNKASEQPLLGQSLLGQKFKLD
jgi:hypothetical protein